MKPKNIRVNLFLFSITCIVLLCILEIILRIYYDPYVVKIKGDEILLSRKVKTWTYTHDIASFSDKIDKVVTVKRNSIGFRGDNPPQQFSEYLTIVAVGGSTTYNAKISEGKTWIDLLGQKLETNFKHLWVNNAGFNGQSTISHLILLKDHLIKLNPKVILYLVGTNDSKSHDEIGLDTGWRDYKTKEIEKQKSEYMHRLEEKRKLEGKDIKLKFIKFIKTIVKRISNKSEVISLGLTIYRNINAHNRQLTLNREDDIEQVEIIEISEQDRVTIQNRMKRKELKEHLIAYEERLKQLVLLSRRNNIDPIFITQPALYGNAIDDVKNINWGKVKLRPNCILDGELYWQWLEMINDVTRKVAADEDILLIDLAKKLQKSSRNYIDFIHYSNQGNKAVADIIYDELCSYLSHNYSEYVANGCENTPKYAVR